MGPLTPEEMDDFRREMASLAIPEATKDELIHIIDNIVISFVDQAHGLNAVQLSLSARANKHFQRTMEYAKRDETLKHENEQPESIGRPLDSALHRRFEP